MTCDTRYVRVIFTKNLTDKYIKPYTYIDPLAEPLKVGELVEVPVPGAYLRAQVVEVDAPALGDYKMKQVLGRVTKNDPGTPAVRSENVYDRVDRLEAAVGALLDGQGRLEDQMSRHHHTVRPQQRIPNKDRKVVFHS